MNDNQSGDNFESLSIIAKNRSSCRCSSVVNRFSICSINRCSMSVSFWSNNVKASWALRSGKDDVEGVSRGGGLLRDVFKNSLHRSAASEIPRLDSASISSTLCKSILPAAPSPAAGGQTKTSIPKIKTSCPVVLNYKGR